MKKIIMWIITGIFVSGLVACSSGGGVKQEGIVDVDETKKQNLTILDVFQKAEIAFSDLKSLHAEMETIQIMEFNSVDPLDNYIWGVETKTELEAILHPLEAHRVIDMYQFKKMDIEGEGSAEIELYRTKDGVFEKNTVSGVWMKLPDYMFDGISDSLGTIADPRLNPSMFEMFADDFKYEQNDNEYILNLTALDDKFKTLALNVLGWHGATDGGFGLKNDEELLAIMSLNTFDIEIIIDKMTFNTIAFRINLDTEINKDDGTLRIIEKVKADISKINGIKEIIVPQDILDSAIEQPD
jgi:hypothetical protein